MNFKSKKVRLLILSVLALICSRTMLVSFNDPEGPNLLIIVGMAVIIYALSFSIFLFKLPKDINLKRLLLLGATQILVTIGLYFCLR